MSKGALEIFSRAPSFIVKQRRLGRDVRALFVFGGGDSYDHDKGPTWRRHLSYSLRVDLAAADTKL